MKINLKRGIKTLSASLLFSLTLVSCVSAGETNAIKIFVPALDTERDVHITTVGFFDNFEAFDAVTNDFNTYYPNVKFHYERQSGTTINDYLELNTTVDIFMTSDEFFLGDDKDLSKYCADLNTCGIDFSDIDERMLAPKYKNGKLLSFPMGQSVSGLVVNKTLLKKYGLEVPTNLNEFKNCLLVLKNNGLIPLQGPDSKVAAELTYNMAMDYIKEYDIKNNKTEEAYQKLKEIFDLVEFILQNGYTDKELNKTYPYDNYDKAILKFYEGDVAFWSCNSEKVSGMKKRENKSESFKANPFEYDFIYAPLASDGAYVYQEPWSGFSLNKNAANFDYAKEFLRFMVTKDEINKIADIKGIPSVAKEKTSKAIFNTINNTIGAKTFVNDGYITATETSRWSSYIYAYYSDKMTKDEAIRKFLGI